MRAMAVIGTWEDVFGDAAPGVAATADAMRALLRARHAEAVEIARSGERTVCFGFGPKKMSEAYAYLMPQKAHLNLGFFHGAALADPEGLLEGTGKALRHVKLGSIEAAGRPAIAGLIDAARAERGAALGVA